MVPLPDFTSVTEATMIDDQPRFRAPTQTAHDETFLAVVTGDELHEFVFRPVVPGTTDEYISRPPSPWTGVQAGLPPGRYALICYVPSDETGPAHGSWRSLFLRPCPWPV